jgi:hypothetical protein
MPSDRREDMSQTDDSIANANPPDGDRTGQREAAHARTAADTESTTANEAEISRRPPNVLIGFISLAIGILIAWVVKLSAQDFDHQNANLIGLVTISTGSLVLLVCLQRRAQHAGYPFHLPVLLLAAVLCAVLCLRFDGFSGEMVPQFRWRFATQSDLELQTLDQSAPSTAEPEKASDEDDATATVQAALPSPQFLGPNRNGVYPQRLFAIPNSMDDVEVLWNQGIGEGWSSFAVVDDQAITLEQRGDEECLTCYRLSDGELLWIRRHQGRHENPLGGVGPRSTPTIDGDLVFATTATGFVWCIQRQTGETVWTTNLFELAGWSQDQFENAAPWGYAGSPLLVDGLCVLPLGGPPNGDASASLIALDRDSGNQVWKAGSDQLSYASPVLVTLDGVRQIVSVNEKTVTGHAVEDGTPLWEFDWPGSTNTGANCSTAMPVGSDKLLVGKGYAGGSALVSISQQGNAWTAEDVWRSRRYLKTKFNHTCVQGNVGYGLSNGALEAVDLGGPTRYWIQPRRSRSAQGQCVLVEDTLVVQAEAGDIVFVSATTEAYQERFRLPALESKTWNIPTVAGRMLLVRNDRQAICFRLTER